jgi:predicted nuclease with TOPRIM domain
MRTRKTFIHEDGIYEGVSRLPESLESHSKEVVYLDDSFDGYPEKQPSIKMEISKFEEPIDLQLGEEYKLHSQFDNYSHTKYRDTLALAALNDEINNLAV